MARKAQSWLECSGALAVLGSAYWPLLVRLILEPLRLLRLALRLDLLLLQAENKALDFFCVRGCAENLQRVVLQSLNPGLNIGCVLAWVMPNAQLVT
jgi:hypothetical protein